jgi:hypothetical protein
MASEVLKELKETVTPMNTLSELPHLLAAYWSAPFGVPVSGIITLVIMSAFIGMMSIGEPDDPSDF